MCKRQFEKVESSSCLQDSTFAADSYNFSFSVSNIFFQCTVGSNEKDAALLNCLVFLCRTFVSEILPRNPN